MPTLWTQSHPVEVAATQSGSLTCLPPKEVASYPHSFEEDSGHVFNTLALTGAVLPWEEGKGQLMSTVPAGRTRGLGSPPFCLPHVPKEILRQAFSGHVALRKATSFLQKAGDASVLHSSPVAHCPRDSGWKGLCW